MYLCWILSIAIIVVSIWLIITINQSREGFYPRQWWHNPYHGRGWGWRRPWLFDWGNWRPYAYYPAYSGYWKQCPSGSWCPPYKSCLSNECS
jgi:hypothetical protein